ncbi:thioredoxin-related transmembrane protein 1 isoform X3 [Marmota monax]|uniref:thioredoxin-related transmembrane protein 1 isoform X5 n=1 Tax=Marmota marmota marmota TaxID=9994 RepID=UPI0020936A7E|nr:thioredoxin-related transmembrane protein 1 isoform X5 [Marmota marmota marmota]XP_058440512.1 thioredoxin-related transmembrane protein 1 isoform X3 [Marmota monax]
MDEELPVKETSGGGHPERTLEKTDYAPWCPACQNLQPEWESFAEWGEDLEVNVAKVDVTEQTGLSGRFIITALPTIYHCKDGEFRRYQGPRTKKDFINFISEKEWKNIEPVSSWFGPGSVLMSSMSALFRLSMYIRTCHNYFIEDLGLPVWGSYTLFALATLLSGLLLGLCMIFVADCLCPSKRHKPQPYPLTACEFSKPYCGESCCCARVLTSEDLLFAWRAGKKSKMLPSGCERLRPASPVIKVLTSMFNLTNSKVINFLTIFQIICY